MTTFSLLLVQKINHSVINVTKISETLFGSETFNLFDQFFYKYWKIYGGKPLVEITTS